MDDLKQQQLKRRINQALGDIDAMKAQLAEVRHCCAELSAAMRQIREDSERARARAKADAERRRRLKRVV
ncbi:MAG: hypothetical protein KYX62_00405 [Pseudomonadota bacterium]|nr:hypothetical protein [Pseudomonadota bacterium]